jgi:N-acetylmuramoyl-L-alanine amidase
LNVNSNIAACARGTLWNDPGVTKACAASSLPQLARFKANLAPRKKQGPGQIVCRIRGSLSPEWNDSGILGGVPSRSNITLLLVLGIILLSGAFALGTSPQNPVVPQAPPNMPAPQQPPAEQPPTPRNALGVVVLDPAHGGADTGARGSAGITESDAVLSLARLVRISLEAQGLRVVLTRQAGEDPSFDDRAKLANAQHGAIFISLHVSSTGFPGTVRVYSFPQRPAAVSPTPPRPGPPRWDEAQQPYLDLSRNLAGTIQTQMAHRFPGSPDTSLVAAVRQLRTVAVPAVAIEVSSVSLPDRTLLDRMAPLLADGAAHGVADFRPIFEAGGK